MTALVDPVPNSKTWTASGITIDQIAFPNGNKSDACARTTSKVGPADQAVTTYTNLCFDDDLRLNFYGSPGYNMEFHDYKGFGKKQVARRLSDDPEPGTVVVGEVTLLEDESKAKDSSELFKPLATDENRFRSLRVNAETLQTLSQGQPPIAWPTVHSGNVHGRLAIYLSTDASGQVREAWPLNSDNAGLDDSVRDQVRHWKLKVAVDANGQPVQVEGVFPFSFETRIADPLPVLSDAETRSQATKIVEPVWPPNSVHSGQVVEVNIGVNEHGSVTGSGYTKTPQDLVGAVNAAIQQWTFRPLIRDGKPQYFHGTLQFTVK